MLKLAALCAACLTPVVLLRKKTPEQALLLTAAILAVVLARCLALASPVVEELRALFWEDLDACLARSLKEQVEYLKSTGKPVYPLTLQAERYYSAIENAKN